MEAFFTMLDLVAPFNVSIIPDNYLTRIIFKNDVGKAIPNLISVKFRKFLFEDLPQMILQIIFLSEKGFANEIVIFNLLSTILNMLFSIYYIMSIRPSNIE